ncbi:hypothetical protein DUI87_04022 [Hirundo rustica rustica]|uniref:protein-tyrosine-phosphatase n=1 Tax=Hirundo rustica rustica TaxID=333673 RepID=A0A3M0L1I1_HIRRU|nr:hypothetical protein DUI87_04022 [Hirundo rustica rustica]
MLRATAEDQIPRGFPTIDMGPQLKVVERTRTATMLCAASGNPDPEITWFKDFLPVDTSNNNGRIKQLRSGALQIELSEESDQGKYECVATNSAGTRYSAPANLYVRVRRVPPRFSIPPTNHEIMPGGSVNITCVAVGSPMPYVKWMLGAEDLTPEDDMPIGRNVLELNDVRQSANYTCVAMSTLGVIEAIAQITVKALPKPPGTPVVTESTATSITLTWDSGNPEPVSYYIIQHKPKNSEEPYKEIDGVATTRYSVAGLSPYSEYEFRVVAVNNIGRGPPSEPVSTRTSEQAPSSAPRNVQARMLSSTTILVQWEEPEEPNGQIQGYRVYYTMDPTQHVNNWMKHNVADSHITTIGNLVPQKTYSVKVLAFTSVGDGPLSSDIQVITQTGVPGQPLNFKAEPESETSILLSWTPPRSDTISSYELVYKDGEHGEENGIITAYSIKYIGIDGEDVKAHEILGISSDSSQYLLEQLEKWTEYRISVTAHTDVGPGPESLAVLIRTDEDVPSGPPRKVEVEAVNSTAVKVSWRSPVPNKQHGQIRGYQVHYVRMENGEPKGQPMLKDIMLADAQEMIISGLQPETTYSFTVTAYTTKGDGARSKPKLVSTTGAVPGKPRLVISHTQMNTALIQWHPPVETFGPLQGYRLKFGRKDMDTLTTMEFSEKEDHFTATDIHKGASYVFRLSARNKVGFGEEMVKEISVPEEILYDDGKMEVDGRATQKLITNLKPETSYSFVLTNRGNSAGGLQHRVTAKTAPDVLRTKPVFIGKTNLDGMITVELPEVPSNENIKGYYIVIVPLKRSRGKFIKPWESPDEMELDELLKEIARKRRSIRLGREVELKPYIAAHFEVLPTEFTLGDKKHYGGFENKQLQSGQEYVFFVLAVMEHSESTMYATSPYSDPVVSMDLDPQPITDEEEGLIWVVGPVLAVVFIICIVIAILLYKRKRAESDSRKSSIPNSKEVPSHHPTDPVELRRLNFQTPEYESIHSLLGAFQEDQLLPVGEEKFLDESIMYRSVREKLLNYIGISGLAVFTWRGMASHPPIPILELADHIERLKANDNLKFSQEYESIDPGQQFTWEHSNLEVNKPKNRYANVIAYDHSRVLLSAIEGIPGSDYINANYIDGYRKQNAYIATQGALPETFGDFWRMMWEQQGATVVMMTKLEERSRIKKVIESVVTDHSVLHEDLLVGLYLLALISSQSGCYWRGGTKRKKNNEEERRGEERRGEERRGEERRGEERRGLEERGEERRGGGEERRGEERRGEEREERERGEERGGEERRGEERRGEERRGEERRGEERRGEERRGEERRGEERRGEERRGEERRGEERGEERRGEERRGEERRGV